MLKEYKIQKYLSKLNKADSLEKQQIYQLKLSKYNVKQYGGIGSTNTLIVFDSSKISGSDLDNLMQQKNGENIKVPLMSTNDLEKILSLNAYVIEEKKNFAKLLGSSSVLKTLTKAKEKISSIDINILKNDDIKKANTELKNIETIFNTIEKLLTNASSLLTKKMNETQVINDNYSKLLSERQNFTTMAKCTSDILLISQNLYSNMENRNTKILELNNTIKSEKDDYLEKIKTINLNMDELIQLNQKTLELEKSYNDSIKTYNSCTNPENELKLSNTFTVINAKDIAVEIASKTNEKLNLDAYMICIVNTIGKNELLKIEKIQ